MSTLGTSAVRINGASTTSVMAHAGVGFLNGLVLLKAEREESIEGVRQGLADAAAGRTQPLAEAFADLRRELDLHST